MKALTELPRYTAQDVVTGCCPVFHPEQWDKQWFDFKDFTFIQAYSKSILHIPLNLGSVMTQTQKAIDDAKQGFDDRYLILSKDVSSWKTEHLFYVKGDVSGYPSIHLKGLYYARVFDGPYQDVPKWMAQVQEEFKQEGKTIQDLWISYTTCPKCAKAYGHNYCIVFSQ